MRTSPKLAICRHGCPLRAWRPRYPQCLRPRFPWAGGTSHGGAGGLSLSGLVTGPRRLHPGGPGQRLAGGGRAVCLSVRLSVSTHHRAQSLFPRLKPSQLKSSKPRVVGATPPPAEERDRCSREGGGEGALRSLPVAHAPPRPCTCSLPTRRSPGPPGSRDRPGGGQSRQKQPPRWVPAGCCLPTPLSVLLPPGTRGAMEPATGSAPWPRL